MGCLWRSHRITKENKPPSRSNVYYLYWQGGSQSPQWPTVLKRWRKKADINKVLELWANHCIRKTNIINERYKFNNRMQEQAESIDTFITTLRAFAKTRDFGTLKDDLICDRIVCSVRENGIRRKLLQVSGLTLSKCVDICGRMKLPQQSWSKRSQPKRRLQEAEGTQTNVTIGFLTYRVLSC